MVRFVRGMLPIFTLVGLFSATHFSTAGGKEDVLKRLAELNKLSGTEPMQGEFEVLKKDKDGAQALIEAALPLAKEKKEALSYNAALVLGLLTAETKDIKKSEPFFRLCMEKAAKLQSESKILQSYGALIDLYFDNKKYDDSARICQELLELKTDDGKPRIVLYPAMTKLGLMDFEEANGFDTTQRIRPGVHRLLIQAITKQGNYDKALKLVDNLIKAKDHWMELELKAYVQREAGKFDDAAKTYEDVIDRVGKDKEILPEEKEFRIDRYRYMLSNVYLDANKVKDAAQQLRLLLAKRPDNPGYNNDLGYILADNGLELDDAEKMIRKALELDKKKRQASPDYDPATDHDNGAYLDSLGWVLFKKGNLKEAKKYLIEAIKDKEAQHIEIYDHLGDVHMALGEKTEAVAAWRKGLEFVGETRRELERKAAVEKKIEQNK